jgi:hypothetical protein
VCDVCCTHLRRRSVKQERCRVERCRVLKPVTSCPLESCHLLSSCPLVLLPRRVFLNPVLCLSREAPSPCLEKHLHLVAETVSRLESCHLLSCARAREREREGERECVCVCLCSGLVLEIVRPNRTGKTHTHAGQARHTHMPYLKHT